MMVLLGFEIMACGSRALKVALLLRLEVEVRSLRVLEMGLLFTFCHVMSCHVMSCHVM